MSMASASGCSSAAKWPPLAIDTPSGGRRLREYIDIQVAGSRAYIAWTHAPAAPSRVRASWIQFE